MGEEGAAVATVGPLIIVVGGDALALNTAEEICELHGHRVVVLWRADGEFAHAVERIGAVFIAASPDSGDGLDRAGVRQAVTILALSRDDPLNLRTALRARDANPRIRIVLRQFNRTLAPKIEQNLPDCAVLSLAWHSAATYAAAAIDPNCFRGLQFPEPAGPLTGFAHRSAAQCELGDATVAEAERTLGARIVAVDGDTGLAPDTPIGEQARLVVYGAIARLQESGARRDEPLGRRSLLRRWREFRRRRREHRRRLDPILRRLALAAFAVFVLGTLHFHHVFGGDWLNAAYFVVTTMTTTGFGDLTPDRHHPLDMIAAILLMLSGITFSGLFIAFGASLLTRVQWVRMQGLRPVHRRGHVVLCGAGSVGSGVIELLRALDKPLVVVESTPDPALVEQAREQRFDLLTGDASRDMTLDLCNLGAAHALIALTNVDTLNLEIALGARARNPTLPIVLRIAEAGFAASITRHFEFETTFSVEALAAPAFAGLSRFAGARGRLAFDGQEFAVGVFEAPTDLRIAPPGTIPLAVGRADDLAIIHDFAEVEPGERALALVPLAPFKDGSETFAAAADRRTAG
jgi:voltage-gated potassium channel Kch